jgi:hypothetical protein
MMNAEEFIGERFRSMTSEERILSLAQKERNLFKLQHEKW